jgi:hypothetical protein
MNVRDLACLRPPHPHRQCHHRPFHAAQCGSTGNAAAQAFVTASRTSYSSVPSTSPVHLKHTVSVRGQVGVCDGPSLHSGMSTQPPHNNSEEHGLVACCYIRIPRVWWIGLCTTDFISLKYILTLAAQHRRDVLQVPRRTLTAAWSGRRVSASHGLIVISYYNSLILQPTYHSGGPHNIPVAWTHSYNKLNVILFYLL